MLLKEVFATKEEVANFATAINYKRGWLKREMENYPDSEHYKRQLSSSMDSFPELYI